MRQTSDMWALLSDEDALGITGLARLQLSVRYQSSRHYITIKYEKEQTLSLEKAKAKAVIVCILDI